MSGIYPPLREGSSDRQARITKLKIKLYSNQPKKTTDHDDDHDERRLVDIGENGTTVYLIQDMDITQIGRIYQNLP